MRDVRNRALGWGTGVLLAMLAVWNVWRIVLRSADPRQYFDSGDPAIASWTYPTLAVVTSSLLIAGEAAILWAILFSPGPPPRWRRAMLGVVVTTAGALFGILISGIHSPAYVATHITWICELAVVAIATLAVSGVGALISRLSTRSRGSV
jgi:hypothetical protein